MGLKGLPPVGWGDRGYSQIIGVCPLLSFIRLAPMYILNGADRGFTIQLAH